MKARSRAVEARRKLDELRDQYRSRALDPLALWRALSSKPRSAEELAKRVGHTTERVRATIEWLRDRGVPVWNSWGRGFWTDQDFSNVPRRRGNRGFSALWQRQPA